MKVRMFDLRVSDNQINKELNYHFKKVLKHGKFFFGPELYEIENKISKYLKKKYSVGLDSGSSALYLALKALGVGKGDEVITTPFSWIITSNAIVANGAKPVFVDIGDDYNINADLIEKKITKKTKAILAVHVLGNSTYMDELKKIVKKNNLTLVEDTCESLGSKYNSKYLGTFGRFGTFSFFVSHQISAGEGGMIVCNDYNDYKIIHSLRAHGWDRGLNNNKSKNDFRFINSGFNLRPMDITAAIGLNQFKRLNQMIKIRANNREKIINSIKKLNNWNNQIEFLHATKKVNPSWFGLPILISKKFIKKKQKYLKFLNKNGIETRPIISGNFLNQPVAKLYKLNKKKEYFKNAEEIDKRGFFIGLHANKIDDKMVKFLTNKLLMINKL